MPTRTHAHRARATLGERLAGLSATVSRWAGSGAAFGWAFGVVLIWLAVGPFVHFSNGWQLVINTGTTIVTFLMVFLLQRAQNKDALAIQLKLDELVAALTGPSNRLIDVESLSEGELETLRRFYGELAALAKRDVKLSQSHSIEEARARHAKKR
ncbi:MAG TPA: low affinity iron permease family protein [Vicinamibacterales bacterium]|nr:low affinity iron permease family protein [Vicinamibacterales bacterium]